MTTFDEGGYARQPSIELRGGLFARVLCATNTSALLHYLTFSARSGSRDRPSTGGVIYNVDDDNSYATALWDELRTVRPGRVAVFTVQMDRHGFLERALYDATGRFMGFDAGWCRAGGWSEIRLGPRFFCVDMGGFAFSSELLWSTAMPLANHTAAFGAGRGGNLVATRPKPWDYRGIMKWMPVMAKVMAKRRRQAAKRTMQRVRRQQSGPPLRLASLARRRPGVPPEASPPLPVRIEWRGGESEFLQALMPGGFPEDLQPLGNCGHDVLVYHNGFLAEHSHDPKHASEEREAHRLWQHNVHAPARLGCKSDGW